MFPPSPCTQCFPSPQQSYLTLHILIHIDDIDDSAPKFESELIKFTISETARVGSLLDISQARALDEDLGEW